MNGPNRTLTPQNLATPSRGIVMPEGRYCAGAKRRVYDGTALMSLLLITFNTTQTFDSHGKPTDSDNDK